MARAGAGLADDERVVPFGDEPERMQVEAGRARQRGVEAPVEVGQCDALAQPALLVAPLHQSRSAPIRFILQDQREGVEEGFLVGLRLQHPRFERGADTGQAQRAQCALNFNHVHAHGGVVLLGGWYGNADIGAGPAVADFDLVLVQTHQHAAADQRRARRIAAVIDADASVVGDGALALGEVAKSLQRQRLEVGALLLEHGFDLAPGAAVDA
jgi:hypothetical protein